MRHFDYLATKVWLHKNRTSNNNYSTNVGLDEYDKLISFHLKLSYAMTQLNSLCAFKAKLQLEFKATKRELSVLSVQL